MRKLKLITVTEDHVRFIWEVQAYLESVKNIGWLDKVQVLVFKPAIKAEYDKRWEIIAKLYPEAKFFFYSDDKVDNSHSLKALMDVYHTIIRPFVLKRHYERYPELSKYAVLYTDTDIIFTKKPDIEKYLDDDFVYVSDTVSTNDYMSHSYFESKEKDVDPLKLQEYKTRNILAECAHQVGVEYDTILTNKANTGGVQYLFKSLTWEFWEKVLIDCIHIRIHLMNVNQSFFPGITPQDRENKGFQSWCADLWSTLWNLWAKGIETRVAPELEFAWATDYIEKLAQRENISILHNAGVTDLEKMIIRDGKREIEAPAFYKGKMTYATGELTPFRDLEYLQSVVDHEVSQKYCTTIYTQNLLDIQKKYQVTY